MCVRRTCAFAFMYVKNAHNCEMPTEIPRNANHFTVLNAYGTAH